MPILVQGCREWYARRVKILWLLKNSNHRHVVQSPHYTSAELPIDMVRDYETPTVPPAWQTFARDWANRLGLDGKELSLICSPDRYGIAVVLRLIRDDGVERIATRRSSDADDAVERRQAFLEAVRTKEFKAIELDVAGYYIGEGTVSCGICGDAPSHEEWQHTVLRELLRIADPVSESFGSLSPEDADDAELDALNKKVAQRIASR